MKTTMITTMMFFGLPLIATGQSLTFSYSPEVIPSSLPGADATPGVSIMTQVKTDAPQARVCLSYHTVDATGARTDRTGCQTVAGAPAGAYGAISRIWLTSDQISTAGVDQITVSAIASDGSETSRTVKNPVAFVQY